MCNKLFFFFFIRGGLVGEEDKSGMLSLQFHNQVRNWEEQMLINNQQQPPNPNNNNNNASSVSANAVDVKQEHSPTSYVYAHHHGNGNDQDHQFQTAKPTSASAWSHPITASAANSSPKSSCVTSFTTNMLDFSNTNNNHSDVIRHPPPDRSSEVFEFPFLCLII